MASQVRIKTPLRAFSQNRITPLAAVEEMRGKVADNFTGSERVSCRLFSPRKFYLFSSPYLLFLIAQCLCVFLSTTALGQEVTVLGVEITQAIQAMNVVNSSINNTVPLIKNKPTLVRVYFDVSQIELPNSRQFAGSLWVARTNGPGLIVLTPSYPILAEPAVNERPGLTARLDFIIPWEVLGGEGLLVGPLHLLPGSYITTPMHPNPTAPACNGCDFTMTKSFRDTAPLRIRLVGVEYMHNGTIFNTLPNPNIASRVYSWLSRAYPVDPNSLSVEYSQPPFSFDMNTMLTHPPPSYADADCPLTNFFLRDFVRTPEVESVPMDDPLRRTHYIGVVYDGTDLTTTPPTLAPWFKRGCSDQGLSDDQLSSASLEIVFSKVGSVPSGPVGPPPDHPSYQKPPWFGDMGNGTFGYWDDDGEYGDWYVGHELGHLLGLQHINNNEVDHNQLVCTPIENEDMPPGYPFPNGQLSGADGTYAGFDSEGRHLLTSRSLPGQSWHDLMTYCVRQWPSHETYRHIQCRINRENNLPCNIERFVDIFTHLHPEVGFRMIPVPPPSPLVTCEPHCSQDKLVKKPLEPATTSSDPKTSPTPQVTSFLNVLASINWKERKGHLQFVTLIGTPDVPPGKKDDRVKIRLTDSSGTTEDYPITPPTNTGVLLDTSALQWVEAVVPFKPRSVEPRTVKIELVIEGQIVDLFNVGTTAPTLRNINLLPPTPKIPDTEPDLKNEAKRRRRNLVFTWQASAPTDSARIFFSVLISLDGGKTWQVAALLSEQRFEIPRERLMGAKSIMLRVTASDGINSTTATSPPLAIPPVNATIRNERNELEPR